MMSSEGNGDAPVYQMSQRVHSSRRIRRDLLHHPQFAVVAWPRLDLHDVLL